MVSMLFLKLKHLLIHAFIWLHRFSRMALPKPFHRSTMLPRILMGTAQTWQTKHALQFLPSTTRRYVVLEIFKMALLLCNLTKHAFSLARSKRRRIRLNGYKRRFPSKKLRPRKGLQLKRKHQSPQIKRCAYSAAVVVVMLCSVSICFACPVRSSNTLPLSDRSHAFSHLFRSQRTILPQLPLSRLATFKLRSRR